MARYVRGISEARKSAIRRLPRRDGARLPVATVQFSAALDPQLLGHGIRRAAPALRYVLLPRLFAVRPVRHRGTHHCVGMRDKEGTSESLPDERPITAAPDRQLSAPPSTHAVSASPSASFVTYSRVDIQRRRCLRDTARSALHSIRIHCTVCFVYFIQLTVYCAQVRRTSCLRFVSDAQ